MKKLFIFFCLLASFKLSAQLQQVAGRVSMKELATKAAAFTEELSRDPTTGEIGKSTRPAIQYPLMIEVVDGITNVPGAGTQTRQVLRVPAVYNGYSITAVSYGVETTGLTGTAEMQIRKNGSGTAGVTFTAGQGVKDVTGLTGLTVATGDIIDVEIISNSMATPQQGLWVTVFFSPN